MDRDRPSPHEVDTQLAAAWRDHRQYLLDLAFRMLGGITDAEDAVQEGFIRLLGVDLDEIEDLRGWLIVVVTRLCLDQLRSARVRREEAQGAPDADGWPASDKAPDPADRITLDDSVRMALLVVLDRLSPAERAAFVLHDVFQVSFEGVGSILGKSPAACRQLASRARKRVHDEAGPESVGVDLAGQRRVAERFIAACATGDLDQIMEVLDAKAVGEVDFGPAATARFRRLVGRAQVARGLLSRFGPGSAISFVSQPVNGSPAALAFRGRELVGILVLTEERGLISHIQALADPVQLSWVASRLSPQP